MACRRRRVVTACACDPAVSRPGAVGLGVGFSCFFAVISAHDAPRRACSRVFLEFAAAQYDLLCVPTWLVHMF
jgi:hypothetical protein